MSNLNWNIDTGKDALHEYDGRIYLCRPRQGRPAAALLTEGDTKLPDDLVTFARHMVVRSWKRSFDDYDRRIIEKALGLEPFLNSIIARPHAWRKGAPDRLHTVRWWMAARRIIVAPGEPPLRMVRPEFDRAWIQHGRVGRGKYLPRVWAGNWRSEFLPSREAAVRLRDRMNVRTWRC